MTTATRPMLVGFVIVLAACSSAPATQAPVATPPSGTGTPATTPVLPPAATPTLMPVAATSAGVSESPTPPAQTPAPPSAGAPPAWIGFLDVLGVSGVRLRSDPTGDFEYADPSKTAGYTPAGIDIVDFAAAAGTLTDAQAADLTKTSAKCGQTDPVLVFCNQDRPLPGGDYAFVGFDVAGPIPQPLAQGEEWVWATVTDQDGTATGNWGAKPPFTGDTYQGADVWLEGLDLGPTGQAVAKTYVLGTDQRQPARTDTGTKYGNLVTDTRLLLWPATGAGLFIIPRAQMGAGYRLANFATKSPGPRAPEGTGSDFTEGPDPGAPFVFFPLP